MSKGSKSRVGDLEAFRNNHDNINFRVPTDDVIGRAMSIVRKWKKGDVTQSIGIPDKVKGWDKKGFKVTVTKRTDEREKV